MRQLVLYPLLGGGMPVDQCDRCSQSLASVISWHTALRPVIGYSGHVGIWAHPCCSQVDHWRSICWVMLFIYFFYISEIFLQVLQWNIVSFSCKNFAHYFEPPLFSITICNPIILALFLSVHTHNVAHWVIQCLALECNSWFVRPVTLTISSQRNILRAVVTFLVSLLLTAHTKCITQQAGAKRRRKHDPGLKGSFSLKTLKGAFQPYINKAWKLKGKVMSIPHSLRDLFLLLVNGNILVYGQWCKIHCDLVILSGSCSLLQCITADKQWKSMPWM